LNFEVNPNEFNPPGRQANMHQETVVSPGGNTILFQGRDQVRTGTMSGAIISQSWYNSLSTWADKWNPLVLEDDQGQTWNIVITRFTKKRIRRRNDWRYDWTMTFTEI
jgi:hypothetical protein